MRMLSKSFHASCAITAIAGILLSGCAGTPTQGALTSCETPLEPAVENSCVVTPQASWRGAKPDAAAAARLIALDVKTIVNLEWLHDDRPSFQAAVAPAVGRREIDCFRVRDWAPLVAIAPRPGQRACGALSGDHAHAGPTDLCPLSLGQESHRRHGCGLPGLQRRQH